MHLYNIIHSGNSAMAKCISGRSPLKSDTDITTMIHDYRICLQSVGEISSVAFDLKRTLFMCNSCGAVTQQHLIAHAPSMTHM